MPANLPTTQPARTPDRTVVRSSGLRSLLNRQGPVFWYAAWQVQEVEVSRFNPARHRDDWETLPEFAAAGSRVGGGKGAGVTSAAGRWGGNGQGAFQDEGGDRSFVNR